MLGIISASLSNDACRSSEADRLELALPQTGNCFQGETQRICSVLTCC